MLYLILRETNDLVGPFDDKLQADAWLKTVHILQRQAIPHYSETPEECKDRLDKALL